MKHRTTNAAILLACSCAFLLLGCATADVLQLDKQSRNPTNPAIVEVLLEEPHQAYKAIGLIEVSDEGWGLSLNDLKKKLVKEAAKLGGDAVIIGREPKSAGAVFMPVGNTFFAVDVAEKKLVGKVIVFTH